MKALPLLCAATLAACASMPDTTTSSLSVRPFGTSKSGQPATLWTLRAHGIEVDVTDHGATLVAVRAPDRGGLQRDIVLGFDDVSGYESDRNQYFGCTTGRVCNRIANAEFSLDGYTYRLAKNNGPHHLHGGGPRSLDKVHWQAVATGGDSPGVQFAYTSRNGEEGYPGNLSIVVTYRLLAGGSLHIDYEATTDQRTPVNLTNHAYWNLAGEGAATIGDHELWIDADRITPTDATLIPDGRFASVAGTPLDFRQPTPIGLRIAELNETPALGYDHNYVLNGTSGLRRAAVLRHAASGRVLEIRTTEPGLQFYSGNFLRGQAGKGGKPYAHRSGLCLETQHFPDSIHQPHFPTTILEPKLKFRSSTVIAFRAE